MRLFLAIVEPLRVLDGRSRCVSRAVRPKNEIAAISKCFDTIVLVEVQIDSNKILQYYHMIIRTNLPQFDLNSQSHQQAHCDNQGRVSLTASRLDQPEEREKCALIRSSISHGALSQALHLQLKVGQR